MGRWSREDVHAGPAGKRTAAAAWASAAVAYRDARAGDGEIVLLLGMQAEPRPALWGLWSRRIREAELPSLSSYITLP